MRCSAAARLFTGAPGQADCYGGRNQCQHRSRGPVSPCRGGRATGRTTAARPMGVRTARCHHRSSRGLRRQERLPIPGHRDPLGNSKLPGTRRPRGNGGRRRHHSGSRCPGRVETGTLEIPAHNTPDPNTRDPSTLAASPPEPHTPVHLLLPARPSAARRTANKGSGARDNLGTPATQRLPSRASSPCGP